MTGGAGFIGSHLVDSLMTRGFRVRVVDNMSNGSPRNVGCWLNHAGFELSQGDLKDPDVATKSVQGVNAVFHLSANPDVRIGELDPSIHFRENLTVTFNLLEAIRKNETAKYIVFASSSTVYGEPNVFPTPEGYGPLLPISIYGASKLGCESLISSYCHTFNLKATILRFANIVGKRATHGVIIDFIRKLSHNSSELKILGDGRQKKSYLHVTDLVNAFSIVLNNIDKNESPQVYNVGSQDQIDVTRIAEIVCEEMSLHDVKHSLTGGVDGGRGWKGDARKMLLSIDGMLGLGWKPRLGSEEAVRLACKELLNSMPGHLSKP